MLVTDGYVGSSWHGRQVEIEGDDSGASRVGARVRKLSPMPVRAGDLRVFKTEVKLKG